MQLGCLSNHYILMDKWIDSMIVSYPIDCSIHNIPEISQVKYKPRKEHIDAVKSAPLTIRNGWVTRGDLIMTRGTYPHKSEPGTTGWQGIGSLTLFYPGRTGQQCPATGGIGKPCVAPPHRIMVRTPAKRS